MNATPSVAAVVASDDKDFAHFPGSMRLQASKQEMITEMHDMVYHRLMHFAERRGFLPRRILFFRDGVSEDQFVACQEIEVPQIRAAFNKAVADAPRIVENFDKAKSATKLQLTFIVVGKRHHTRFYATREKQTYRDNKGNSTNPPRYEEPRFKRAKGGSGSEEVKLNGNLNPGLLVEKVVTRPKVDKTFDFFLQSHAALQGTARSAHYSVLQQDGFTVEDIKQYTHAFCYNYMRATKGVSYAGPAYYADRLCERGTHYLRAYVDHPQKKHATPRTPGERDNGKAGDKEHAKRVATAVGNDELWCPRLRSHRNIEPNPWHPDFDDRMFWL